MRMLSEKSMWTAVTRSNPAFDAKFVYAVRTTGVFCKPSCKSKRPLRANVAYFATPTAALLAGYRACKRCQPLDNHPELSAILRTARLLESREQLRSDEIARRVGVSQSHLSRQFKKALGVSMQAYARRLANERAKEGLVNARVVTRAIGASSIQSATRYYERIGPELGMSSRSASRGGAGVLISHASFRSSLGQVIVAWTSRGVCHVALGERDAPMLAELVARFPSATHVESQRCPFKSSILRAASGNAHPNVPLDIQGTAFQEKVWRALKRIPRGETRTYSELARDLRATKSARAVGSACGKNTIALLVPCHRAVRADGVASGYRWGLARRRAILQREAKKAR